MMRMALLASECAVLLSALAVAQKVDRPLPPQALTRLGNTGSALEWVAFSPDGLLIASRASDESVRIWQIRTGKKLRELQPACGGWVPLRPVVFSPDGKTVASGSKDDGILIWDVDTGHIVWFFATKEKYLYQYGFSPDGETLVSEYGEPCRIKFHRLRGTRSLGAANIAVNKRAVLLASVAGTPISPARFAFAPDGKTLAYPTVDDCIHLIEVRGGKITAKLTGAPSLTTALAIEPNGKLLVAGGGQVNNRGGPGVDTAIVVWNLEKRTQRPTMTGHTQPIYCLTFSPDGRTLASAGQDRTIRLWEMASGKELFQLRDGKASASCVTFSPDGKTLASAMSNGTAVIWGLAPPGWKVPEKLDAEAVRRSWVELAGADAPQAYRAIWALSACPADAILFLKNRLETYAQVKPKRIRRLIVDLDAQNFRTREDAMAELGKLGERAESALRDAAKNGKTAEIRQRATRLLESLANDPEALRIPRAIWVLERIGTPAARELLADLAKGAPDARLTQEAQAALRRLKR